MTPEIVIPAKAGIQAGWSGETPRRDPARTPGCAGYSAAEAASWAVAHVSEREAVFGHVDLLAATLASEPGAVTVDAPPAHHR